MDDAADCREQLPQFGRIFVGATNRLAASRRSAAALAADSAGAPAYSPPHLDPRRITSKTGAPTVAISPNRMAEFVRATGGLPLNAIPFKTHHPLSLSPRFLDRKAAQNRTLIRRGGATDGTTQFLNRIAVRRLGVALGRHINLLSIQPRAPQLFAARLSVGPMLFSGTPVMELISE